MLHQLLDLVVFEHAQVLRAHEQVPQLAPVDHEVQVTGNDRVDHLSRQRLLFDRQALHLGHGLDRRRALDLLAVEDRLAEVLPLSDFGDELVFFGHFDLAFFDQKERVAGVSLAHDHAAFGQSPYLACRTDSSPPRPACAGLGCSVPSETWLPKCTFCFPHNFGFLWILAPT